MSTEWKFSSTKLKILIVLSACSIFYLTRHHEKSPVVRTSVGDVQGFVDHSRQGRRFYRYHGIPYAQPPVGNLRFESPQPLKRWNGTLVATSHAAECKGFDIFFTHRILGEEDCLFLDIIVPELIPKEQKPKTLLPVIVHIHGGGFQAGSNKDFEGQFFMDDEIVLVNIQYRLGIFGFFSTKDEVIKGNMGLKDQVMALKWIQTNIMKFGGDPTQVTILGESAGGSSVQLLLLSPMGKGLFQQAITMNVMGTSDMWQYNQDNVKIKTTVAEYFKCPTTSEELARCLRDVDENTLASYHSNFVTPYIYNNTGAMGPVIENSTAPDAFLTENPRKLLEDGNIASKVPWMVGASLNEGLILLGMMQKFMTTKDMVDDKNWDSILPHLIFYDNEKRPEAARKIKEHLIENGDLLALNETERIRKLSEMITEKMFFAPLVESAKLYGKSSSVYMYLYTYEGFIRVFDLIRYSSPGSWLPSELTIGLQFFRDLFCKLILRWPQDYFGPSHGDDIFLLFNVPLLHSELFVNYFDFEMSKLMVTTFVDFASFKKPKFQGLDWPALNSSNGLECMELNIGPPRILQDPFKDRLRFWDNLNLPHT